MWSRTLGLEAVHYGDEGPYWAVMPMKKYMCAYVYIIVIDILMGINVILMETSGP